MPKPDDDLPPIWTFPGMSLLFVVIAAGIALLFFIH